MKLDEIQVGERYEVDIDWKSVRHLKHVSGKE